MDDKERGLIPGNDMNWLQDVFHRAGPCPTCGVPGGVGRIEQRDGVAPPEQPAGNQQPFETALLENIVRFRNGLEGAVEALESIETGPIPAMARVIKAREHGRELLSSLPVSSTMQTVMRKALISSTEHRYDISPESSENIIQERDRLRKALISAKQMFECAANGMREIADDLSLEEITINSILPRDLQSGTSQDNSEQTGNWTMTTSECGCKDAYGNRPRADCPYCGGTNVLPISLTPVTDKEQK